MSSPVAYVVRAARHADLRSVAAIERAVFPDPWTHAMFAAHVRYAPADTFLVAEGAVGDVAGYVITRTAADEAELLNVAVDPRVRRAGVARALVQAASRSCAEQGAASMVLEVRESNAPARALYSRLGFAPIGRRRAYYETPREDAIVMRARLPLTGAALDRRSETMTGGESRLPLSDRDPILSAASHPSRQETK